jgi:hypothetical protein
VTYRSDDTLGRHRKAAFEQALAGGNLGLGLSSAADSWSAVKALACEGMIQGKDSAIRVVVNFQLACGTAAGLLGIRDHDRHGLPTKVDPIFSEKGLSGKLGPESVLKRRDLFREEHMAHTGNGKGIACILPGDGGRGMGALDDEGEEGSRP